MGTTEDFFEGPPTGLPAPMPRGTALYREGPGPAVVRHVAGYAPFVEFCAAQGVPADDLAADPERLIAFLRTAASALADDSTLSTAAAIFAGNTISRLRPDGQWTAYEGAPPMVGNREMQFDVDRLLDALRGADDDAVRGLIAVLKAWGQEEPVEPPVRPPVPVPPAAGQPRYVRPPLPAATFYSRDGQPIPYGRHWGGRDVLQAVKVTPRDPGAATLTFVLTGYPGVTVHAGVLHDFPFPACGCDACDETAGTTADRLEMLVISVAAGGYSERYPVGRKRWSEYALAAFDGSGSESGQGEPPPATTGRLRDAEIQLREIQRREPAGGWRPWPLRGSSG